MRWLVPPFIIQQLQQERFCGMMCGSVLCLDFTGFTRLTETLMPAGAEGIEVLNHTLNALFTPIVASINAHGGFVAAFAADAVTAVFPGGNGECACLAGLQAREIMRAQGDQHTRIGDFALSARLGVAAGEISWGIVQGPHLLHHYFRGPAIYRAYAAEVAAGTLEISIPTTLAHRLRPKVETTPKGDGFSTVERLLPGREIPCRPFQPPDMTAPLLSSFVGRNIPDQLTGEFRDIVSVFVAFTEMETDAHLQRFIRALDDQLYAYGGYLEGILFDEKGSYLLAVFGAPVAHEDMIQRAMGFAQSMVQRWGEAVKAGISFGTSFAGFKGSATRCVYGVLGREVNLAARLMQQARWGQVLAAGALVTRIRGTHRLRPLGMKQLKGAMLPVRLYQVLEAKSTERGYLFSGTIVGRDSELAAMEQAVAPVFSGRFAGVLYIDGPAGVGKSRLAAEFRQRLRQPHTWLHMPCDNLLQKSFYPIRQFLANYFNQSPANAKKANRAAFDTVWTRRLMQVEDKHMATQLARGKWFLANMLDIAYPDPDNEQLTAKVSHERLFDALKALLKVESTRKPVILDVDDGHAIDSYSLDFLRLLTRNIEAYPLVVISCCRYGADGAPFSFGLDQVTEQRIDLHELARPQIARLVTTRLGVPKVPEDTLSFISSKSGGNPFFVEQIVCFLQEKGLLDDQLALRSAMFAIPTDIKHLLIARIDNLQARLRDTVKVAAVLGREFSAVVLKKMLENMSQATQQDWLQAGEKENIWIAISYVTYLFRHALIRDAAYDMQLRSRLRGLHGLAARAMESVFLGDLRPWYKDIAFHYEQSEDFHSARRYYARAAREAERGYRNTEAIFCLERWLQYEGNERLQVLLNIRLSKIFSFIGRVEAAQAAALAAWQKAKRLHNPILLGRCEKHMGDMFTKRGAYEQAEERLYRALAHFRDADRLRDQLDTRFAVAIVMFYTGHYQKAESEFQKIIKAAEEQEYPLVAARAQQELGNLWTETGKLEQALDLFTNLLTDAESVFPAVEYAKLLGNTGITYYHLTRYKKCEQCYSQALKIMEQAGDKSSIAIAYGNFGSLYNATGRYKKAVDFHKRFLHMATELGHRAEMAIAMSNLGFSLGELGRMEQSLDYFDQAIALGNRLNLKPFVCHTWTQKARALKLMAKHQASLACLKEATSMGTAAQNKVTLAQAELLRAQNLLDLGQQAAARQALKRADKLARHTGQPELLTSLRIAGARLKAQHDPDQALQALRRVASESTAPPGKACALYFIYKLSPGREQLTEAVQAHEALCRHNPSFEHKQRLRELQQAWEADQS